MRRSVVLAIPLLFVHGLMLVLAMNMTPLHISSFAYRMAVATASGSALALAMVILHKGGLKSMRTARLNSPALTHHTPRTWYALSALCYVSMLAMLMLVQMVPLVIDSLVIGGVMGVMFGLGTACSQMGRIERKLRDDRHSTVDRTTAAP